MEDLNVIRTQITSVNRVIGMNWVVAIVILLAMFYFWGNTAVTVLSLVGIAAILRILYVLYKRLKELTTMEAEVRQLYEGED